MIEHLTTQSFKEKVFNFELNEDWKYEGSLPCIIDFYAEWCGPCRTVAPILESLSIEYDGKLNIYKVDVDEEHELASIFGIRSIPTMLFCSMTEKPEMMVGALPKNAIVNNIKNILE